MTLQTVGAKDRKDVAFKSGDRLLSVNRRNPRYEAKLHTEQDKNCPHDTIENTVHDPVDPLETQTS
jgi:hypothetical protein